GDFDNVLRSVRKLLVGVGVVLWSVTGSGLVPARMATAAPSTRLEVLPVPSAMAQVRAASVEDGSGVATPYPLSHVALERAGASAAVVRLRRLAADGWQQWVTVEANHDMIELGDGTVYSSLVRADGATRVETQVVAGDVRDLRVVAIDATTGERQPLPGPSE